MAVQIPSVTGPSQRSRALGAPQVQTVEASNPLLDTAGSALKAGAQIWQKTQEDADTAALIDAESQLSQWKLKTMFSPDNGVYNRKGRNALDITNQTLPQFDQQADAIGNALTNDRQRQRWGQIVASQRNGLNNELNRYEFGERQAYYKEADAASLDSAQQGALAYYQVPGQVAYYQNKGTRVIAGQGQRDGEPPEATELKIRAFNSGVSTGVISRMAVDDPLGAQRYYAQAFPGMTVDDQLKVTKLLGDSVRQQLGSQIGAAAYEMGTGGDRSLTNLIVQAESSGDPAAVSPKGARGLMQLMPDTAREMAAELGLPYDEERLTADPNYNMALGNAYLNKMLGRYNGNATLAVAAYNAGPGSVDGWIEKNGDPRTGEIDDAAWIEKIPFAETRAYTGKIVGQLAPASGKADSPDQKYARGLKWANTIEDADTRRYAIARMDDLRKADDLQAKATYDEAADIALDQGYNAIPAQVLQQIGAEDRVKLQKLDEHRRKGTEPTTDDAKFEEFLRMPAAQLKELSLNRDIRPFLNNADYGKVLTAWQAAQRGSEATQKALAAENSAVRSVMNLAGIQFGNSAAAQSTDNIGKRQQFEANYNRLRDAFVEKNKVDPTPQEAQKIAEQLLVEVRLGNTGWFGNKQVPAWQVKAGEERDAFVDADDIDLNELTPNERQAAVDLLRNQGIDTVTDETITEAYLQVLKARGLEVRR
ncbi:Transglycosylase SLT domain protein [compost metagenome]